MVKPMEQPIPASLELSDKYFQGYWVHVELGMPISKLQKMIASHYKKKPYTTFRGQLHYYLEGRKLKKKGMTLLNAQIVPFTSSRTIPGKARIFFLSDIQAFLDKLDQTERYDGDSGTWFLFPRSKFRFKGGFSLPIESRLDENMTKQLGAADVTGLHLSFDVSPIGLDSVTLFVRDNHISLSIETSFYSSPVAGLIAQTFIQAKKIGSLFVEGEPN